MDKKLQQELRKMELKYHEFPEDMSHLYADIHEGHIAAWEQGLTAYPDAKWHHNKLSDILPFLIFVKPRISLIQDISGLRIISLDKVYHDEEKIIRHGLKPLEKAQILGESELEQIAKWYIQTQTALKQDAFEKTFNIGDREYMLETNSHKNSRHLNLKVLI